ncbi:MAG: DUF4165 domain-containing protein, partial [Shewanella sp.]
MLKHKLKLPALLGALAAIFTGTAQAELLQYSFTAPGGAQRTLAATANYANPTGNIRFALSA